MNSIAAFAILGGAGAFIVLLAAHRAKWRERARAVEETNKTDREANEIKNRVAADPAYRERVRRFFGGS